MNVIPIRRAPRCLRLVEISPGLKAKSTDRCESEQLPGSDLCGHHLVEAARQFRDLTATHPAGKNR